MLIITGTQRCGTSFMANFCKACGYDLGTEFWHEEINGGLESPDICRFFRQNLGDPTFPFSDFDQSISEQERSRIPRFDFEVQKFSFLMMNPKFINIWHALRGTQDKLLILMREAESVYESKRSSQDRKARFNGDSGLLHQSPSEIKQNWYDSFCRILDLGFQYRILKFPNFLDKGNEVQALLRCWGNLIEVPDPGSLELWNSLVDKGKITVK